MCHANPKSEKFLWDDFYTHKKNTLHREAPLDEYCQARHLNRPHVHIQTQTKPLTTASQFRKLNIKPFFSHTRPRFRFLNRLCFFPNQAKHLTAFLQLFVIDSDIQKSDNHSKTGRATKFLRSIPYFRSNDTGKAKVKKSQIKKATKSAAETKDSVIFKSKGRARRTKFVFNSTTEENH